MRSAGDSSRLLSISDRSIPYSRAAAAAGPPRLFLNAFDTAGSQYPGYAAVNSSGVLLLPRLIIAQALGGWGAKKGQSKHFSANQFMGLDARQGGQGVYFL